MFGNNLGSSCKI